MATNFWRMALIAIGFAVAPTTPAAQASLIGDTVTTHVTGTGVLQPGNLNINLTQSAVVGPQGEFLHRFVSVELGVNVTANTIEVRFVRTGSFGDLNGPVTWTISNLDWSVPGEEIRSMFPIPPSFASQLPVQSFRVIDSHT